MTSDYVSWVLGLQGWERAICEDSYMAGEEDVTERTQVPYHTEKESNSVFFCETGCQTPCEWLKSGPAQQRVQDKRKRAAPLKRAVVIGASPPLHLSAPRLLLGLT